MEGRGEEGRRGEWTAKRHLSNVHYRRCEELAPAVVAHLALLVQLVHSPAPISELRHMLRCIHQSDHYRGSRHHLTTTSGGGEERRGRVHSVIPYLSVQAQPRNCVCVCVCTCVPRKDSCICNHFQHAGLPCTLVTDDNDLW